MIKLVLCMLGSTFAALSQGAEPIIDNEHVTVWDTAGQLPASTHDFVAVTVSRKGTVKFGHRGDLPGMRNTRTVVIELKDLPVRPLANETGYPLAFPREHAKKLLENAQVIVWDYVWRPGKSTPMHFHDKDAVVVFEATGALKATMPDGTSTETGIKFGEARFNPRGRVHSETLSSGEAHAVITELR